MRAHAWAVVAAALIPACETAELSTEGGNNVCDPPDLQAPLPSALAETSGLAVSRTHEGVYWTHNDSGGEAAVFALDSTGALLVRIPVQTATNRDWEDIALGPCDGGDTSTCLWIGEIGDNNERHPHAAVYRLPEPDPARPTPARADIFRFSYPDGPRDAEALFVTDEGVHVVTKGRSDAIELFRLPPPYTGRGVATLERVQRIAPPPTSISAQVTAAATDAEGRRAVVRSYAGLRFFAIEDDTLRSVGRPANLVAPTQLKGEGVDYLTGNRLALTSEAQGQRPAQLALLTCDPMRPPADTAADHRP